MVQLDTIYSIAIYSSAFLLIALVQPSQVLAQANASDSGKPVAAPVVPMTDPIPFPLPASGKSKPPGAPVQLSPFGTPPELSPLAQVAPGSIECSATGDSTPLKGLTAIRLTVKNNTDRPITFNGNQTAATIGGVKLNAAAMPDIGDRIKEPDNPHGYAIRSFENTITAAVGVGVLQTVDGEKRRRGPIAERYGFDNIRRIDRLGRFGERILWPGDSTQGLVYFKTDQAVAGAAMQMPIVDFYDKKDSAVISVTVSQNGPAPDVAKNPR